MGTPYVTECPVMAKIAVPIWQDRVSPVLDSARSLLIIDLEDGELISKDSVYLSTGNLAERVEIIKNVGVDTILCGALSRSLRDLLARAHIEVYAWLTGKLDEVLAAYRNGNLNNDRFLLPGCGRGRRRRNYRCGSGRGHRSRDI